MIIVFLDAIVLRPRGVSCALTAGEIKRRPPTLSKQDKMKFLPAKLLKRRGRLYLIFELPSLAGRRSQDVMRLNSEFAFSIAYVRLSLSSSPTG